MHTARWPNALAHLLFGLAIFCGLVACQYDGPGPEGGISEASAASAMEARFDAFLDTAFERRVAESPIQQSRLGRKTDQLDRWDDFSDSYADGRIERTKQSLASLRSLFDYRALSQDRQVSYDLFVMNAEREIRNDEFRRHFYVVDQFNGQVANLLTVLQNNHDVESVTDAQNYIARIAGLREVLHEFVNKLGDRAQFGVLPPAFAFGAMIEDVRAMGGGYPIESTAGSVENAIYADIHTKITALELEPAAAQVLISAATEALRGPYREGFTALLAELERIRPLAEANGNLGVWSLPNGEAFYRNRIRAHTTLDLSAEEIHQVGLTDVARIHREMRAIQQQIGAKGSLQDFFEFVRNDPNNYYEDSDAGREQFLSEARQQVDEIYAVVGDYFHQIPKAKLEVRRVEPWRENSTSIAFYNQPSEDGTRPAIYYANLADMKSLQKYVFTAITYHESVPGHHFQIALAQELPGLPKFRKFGFYNAFTEGWALYAERLAKEMGFYSEPLQDFGRLQDEIWRSVRLVVDTGIHAKQWTRQQSIDYFIHNTPISEGDIVTEVERYFVNPGQALGYKMGMIEILDLRAKAESELGEKYDIRDFHEAVIGAGELPLPVLRQRVARYIEAAK